MAEEKLVKMMITRTYPRGGIDYPPGEPLEVPEHVAASMEEASPPYGRRVRDLPELDATESALEMAAANALDLRGRAGQGSGANGRIIQADVERWLATPGS